MTKRKIALIVGSIVGTVVLAQAVQKTYKLIINGKAQSGTAVVLSGKTYVSLDALKAAGVGASLSGTTLTLTLPNTGGTNQNVALEGCLNEWLLNGLWRFRVTSLEPSTEPMGWRAKVEIRNASKADNISLAGTGWGGMRIILEDGRQVEAQSDAVDIRDTGLLQGASANANLAFPSDDTSKAPKKLFLLLDPKGLTGTNLRYSVADPSFRIKLDCTR